MPEIIVKLGERIIHRYFFDKDLLRIGRARDNDIVIENLSVSRNHARIKREDGHYYLTDLNSANGTLVNGVRVTKTEVFHNDQVAVGKHVLLFLAAEEQGPSGAEPQAPPPGEAPEPEPPPSGQIGVLAVTKGKQAGQEFRVQKAETFIGRASENDVRIHDWFVSKKHAVIIRDGKNFILRDLDSWRGTTVNGNSIREIDLKEGDEIVFGTTVLAFKVVDAEEYAASHPQSSRPPRLETDESWASDSSARHQSASQEAHPPAESEPKAPEEPKSEKQQEAKATPPPDEKSSDSISLEADEPEAGAENTPEGQPDEFAPMTEEELAALEHMEDEEEEGGRDEEEENRRLSWEMLEAEKMFEMSDDSEEFSLSEKDDELAADENAAVGGEDKARQGLAERDEALQPSEEEIQRQDEEEEAALNPPEQSAASPQAASAAKVSQAPGGVEIDESAYDPETLKEIRLWEKALQNRSPVIRRNAAKELKKLTGQDYDWKSDPAGS